jgi:hypothetical protein
MCAALAMYRVVSGMIELTAYTGLAHVNRFIISEVITCTKRLTALAVLTVEILLLQLESI